MVRMKVVHGDKGSSRLVQGAVGFSEDWFKELRF
jgi:hypothetical protein